MNSKTDLFEDSKSARDQLMAHFEIGDHERLNHIPEKQRGDLIDADNLGIHIGALITTWLAQKEAVGNIGPEKGSIVARQMAYALAATITNVSNMAQMADTPAMSLVAWMIMINDYCSRMVGAISTNKVPGMHLTPDKDGKLHGTPFDPAMKSSARH